MFVTISFSATSKVPDISSLVLLHKKTDYIEDFGTESQTYEKIDSILKAPSRGTAVIIL